MFKITKVVVFTVLICLWPTIVVTKRVQRFFSNITKQAISDTMYMYVRIRRLLLIIMVK
jgi:choline-glycine betaine transporter